MNISGIKVRSIDPGRVMILNHDAKTNAYQFQFSIMVNGNISYPDSESYTNAAECKQKMREAVRVLRLQHGLTI